MNPTGEMETFKTLVKNVKQQFRKLDSIVLSFFYYDKSNHHKSDGWNDSRSQELEYAEQRKYLTAGRNSDGNDDYFLNREHPLIKTALGEIEKLDAFLGTYDGNFIEAYKKEYGIEADLTDRKFWEEHFGLRD